MSVQLLVIAEDDDDDFLLMQLALRDVGFAAAVQRACDGEQLLAFLNRWRCERRRPELLILLDLNMPRMDGREALRRIKADTDLRDIKVLILTTSGTDVDAVLCRRLGADGVFKKPRRYPDLVELVRSLSAIAAASV